MKHVLMLLILLTVLASCSSTVKYMRCPNNIFDDRKQNKLFIKNQKKRFYANGAILYPQGNR